MNEEELAALQNEIDEAEQRIVDHQAKIVALRARRLDTSDEEAVLHILLSGVAAMKDRRTKLQAYVDLVGRLKS